MLFVFKKLLLFFAPFVVFYFVRKIGRKKPDKKPHSIKIDKNTIVEGEVIEEKK